jgi:hypothetical protein
MKRYIEFPTDGGEPIVVEVDVDDAGYGTEPVGRADDVAAEAQESFQDALSRLRPATRAVVDQLRDLSPDEATVEFGIKLDAKAGAFLASAGTAANFKVTLKWKKDHLPT